MKRILPFIMLASVFVTSCFAQKQAKQNDKVVAKYLINGYFFEEKPNIPEEIASQGGELGFLLTDKDGIQVQTMRYKAQLPDSIIARSIPKKSVKNAWFFLNEEKEQRRIVREAGGEDAYSALRDMVPAVGKVFPLFEARDVNNRVWTQRDIEGRVAVFYLWQNGCMPCLAEMGELAIWKQQFPDVLFFSATWHDAATTRRITDQYRLTWIPLWGASQMMKWVSMGTIDEDGKTNRNYPMFIVVDSQGVVRRVVNGTDIEKRQETLECIRRYRL